MKANSGTAAAPPPLPPADASTASAGGGTGTGGGAGTAGGGAAPAPMSIPVDAYYESAKKSFLVADTDGNWMQIDTTGLKHRLAQRGLSSRTADTQLLSTADAMVIRIQDERHVQYAGGLAGFRRGLHTINGAKVLVTCSPQVPEAKEGDWTVLRTVIEQQLLPAKPGDPDQLTYFHAWVKLCDTQLAAALERGQITYGQALILAGPKGCGKNLLQDIITVILGGRAASPFAYMSGETIFNHELFLAEHQCISDEQPHKDIKSRVRFGNAIKKVTATTLQAYQGKNRDGRSLTPFWRLTLSVNDEQDHLEVLPPIDDSISDKLILLHCAKHEMPMPAGTPEEKAAFWARLMEDLPGYLHWIRNVFEIPPAVRGSRYGLQAFLHPDIIQLLDDLAPETRLLALIDQIMFMDSLSAFEGTSEEVSRRLMEDPFYGNQAKQLVSNSTTCGRLLAKLAKREGSRVTERRTNTRRLWQIKPPAASSAAEDRAAFPNPMAFAKGLGQTTKLDN